MPVWAIIGIAVAAALIAWVLASVHTRRKDIKKVAYMMDALEDGELNFRFQDRNKFNRTLKTASGPSSRSSGRPTSRIPGPNSSGC